LCELGAPRDEVYPYFERSDNKYYPMKNLSDADIMGWAEFLYHEKLKKFHPDLHEDKELYNEYCQHLGFVYNRIKEIICGRNS